MEEDEPEQRSRADQLQELLLESFAAGMEGLMLKTLDAGAAYQPSKRSDSWVKLKRCCCCSFTGMQLHVSSFWPLGKAGRDKWVFSGVHVINA